MKFPTPMKWENLSFIISKTFPELEKQTIILYCVSESGTRCLEKKITFANYSTKLSMTLILSIVYRNIYVLRTKSTSFLHPWIGENLSFMHTIFPFQNLCRRPLSNKLFIRRISVSFQKPATPIVAGLSDMNPFPPTHFSFGYQTGSNVS